MLKVKEDQQRQDVRQDESRTPEPIPRPQCGSLTSSLFSTQAHTQPAGQRGRTLTGWTSSQALSHITVHLVSQSAGGFMHARRWSLVVGVHRSRQGCRGSGVTDTACLACGRGCWVVLGDVNWSELSSARTGLSLSAAAHRA